MISSLHKMNKNNRLTITLTFCLVFVVMVSISTATISMAHAQTVVPVPKHTYAYLVGAKDGLAAAKVGQYNVGAACTPFTGSDLDHCIAGYYGAVAGYHDARVAVHTIKQGNATTAGGINMTKGNTKNIHSSK